MDTFETSGDHTPLGDLTSACQLIDPNECKQARERARYASMSLDQRNEKKKKHRKSWQRKNGDSSNHF